MHEFRRTNHVTLDFAPPWVRSTMAVASLSVAVSLAAPAALGDEPFMPQRSEAGMLNQFIGNSRTSPAPEMPTETVTNLRMVVKLLTPLNSDFSKPGDPVKAEIAEPVEGLIKSALPVGSMLHGHVERSSSTGRLYRHGQLFVRYYWIEQGGRLTDLCANAREMQGNAMPGKPVTRKRALRGVLMAATTLAVPLAIGSGGLSLAITSGAGAVIGAALADDKKYVRGALRGAWEGAGLTVLDPIVCKGKPVQLGVGQMIELTLAEPLTLPAGSVIRAPDQPGAQSGAEHAVASARGKVVPGTEEQSYSILKTSAKVLSSEQTGSPSGPPQPDPGDTAPPATIDRCREFLHQKNLAAALDAIEKAHQEYPRDQAVEQLRTDLLERVTGMSTTAGNAR